MPKALFFSIPAHGHINPSLPLVAELVGRGHEIIYFTTEHYRDRVEATGASIVIYEHVEDDYFDVRGLDGSVPQLAARELLKTTKLLLPGLLHRVSQEKPDYILYDCMCPWGYYTARTMKLPSVSSASLMPVSPRMLLNPRALVTFMRIFLPVILKGASAGNEANRLGRDLGKQYDVRPLGMTTALNAPADLVISYSSPAYVPFSQSLPENFKLVGWTLQENHADEPFIHTSEHPLIYVSLGTVANENLVFFQKCVTALADAPYDVIISTGGRFAPDHFGTLPTNITIRSWVPQSQVIQQAALFITHGGLNSLHDGLYCGVPLLIVPQQAEQTFNGVRVVALGAGLMLKPGQVTDSALQECVNRLLTDERFTKEAQRIGESLRSAGGMARAVDEIEQLLKT